MAEVAAVDAEEGVVVVAEEDDRNVCYCLQRTIPRKATGKMTVLQCIMYEIQCLCHVFL